MSTIPKLTSDPDFATQSAKLTDLQLQRAETQRQLDAIASQPAFTTSERDRSVRELLGLPNETVPTADELATKLSALDQAIAIQRGIVSEAECTAGRQIAEQMKPQYVAILRRGVKAVKALAEFLRDEANFNHELVANDIRPCGALPRFRITSIDAEMCDRWREQVSEAYVV